MAFSLPHKSPLLQTKGISEPSKVPQVQLSVVLDLWTIVTSPTILWLYMKYWNIANSISEILNRRALNWVNTIIVVRRLIPTELFSKFRLFGV